MNTKKMAVAFGLAIAALGAQVANACGINYSTDASGNTVASGSPCESPSTTPTLTSTNTNTNTSANTNTNTNTNTSAANASAGATATGGTATATSNPTTTSTATGGAATGGKSNATIESGALKSSNSAKNAGNKLITNESTVYEATPGVANLNVANAQGGMAGCVAQKGYSLTVSVVGSSGIGGAYTGEATMVEGCTQAEMNKSLVAQGIASNDPAKNVLAVAVSGNIKALDEVTEARIKLFGRQNSAPAQQGSSVLNQHFYAERAAATQPQFVCNYLDKRTGAVVKGEVTTVQGQPVCTGGGDAAPSPKR